LDEEEVFRTHFLSKVHKGASNMTEWLIANFSFLGNLASILGIILGVPSVVIALVQLHRTKRAAVAAGESAKEAVQRISNVVAVSSIEQICSRSRDLQHLIRGRDLTASATAAFELREALSKFCRSNAALQLQDESGWQDMLETVGAIEDTLEGAAAINKIDAMRNKELLQVIPRLHSTLSMLSTVASEKSGGINAYPIRIP